MDVRKAYRYNTLKTTTESKNSRLFGLPILPSHVGFEALPSRNFFVTIFVERYTTSQQNITNPLRIPDSEELNNTQAARGKHLLGLVHRPQY
jgi:hypothetical protein